MSNVEVLHGQTSVVDVDGTTRVIHQETSASDVLVDRSENTQGKDGTCPIPTDVENLQTLTNKFTELAFKKQIEYTDLHDGIVTNTYDVTESGHVADARLTKDLNTRLKEIEESDILVIGENVEDHNDIIVPESEINDDVTSTATTWSSTMIQEKINELESAKNFYVPILEQGDESYIAQKTVAEIEEAYQNGKLIWVVASDFFLPLRKRVDASTWIFSGYTGKQAFDIQIDIDGVTITYAELASTTDMLPNPNQLKLTGAVTAVYDGSTEVEVEIPNVINDETVELSTTWSSKHIDYELQKVHELASTSEINDDNVGAKTTWSSKKIRDTIEESFYVVRISKDTNGDLTADHTYLEISDYYANKNPNIYCAYGNLLMPLVKCDTQITFSGITTDDTSFNEESRDLYSIVIDEDDSIYESHKTIAYSSDKLSNPYKLTLAGQTSVAYDGSSEVNANILNFDIIPNYWNSPLQSTVTEINNVIANAGRKCSAFLWYTDVDWKNNHHISPALLKYLYQHTPINKTFCGGSIVNSIEDLPYAYEWRSAIRQLPNHFSVLGNLDATSGLSDSQIDTYLFAPEESESVKHQATELTSNELKYFNNYYFDEPTRKTRYIFLDTTGTCANEKYYTDQYNFIINTLNSVEDRWHVIIIANMLYKMDGTSTVFSSSEGRKIITMLDSYSSRENGSIKTPIGILTDVAYDFTNAKGTIEFCICGHANITHTVTSFLPFPVIITANDGCDLTDNTIRGTLRESAVFAIIADYTSGVIHVIRPGVASQEINLMSVANIDLDDPEAQ